MNRYDLLKKIAGETGCRVLEKEPMAKHTTFQIGGEADLYLSVKSKDALKKILKTAKEQSIPIFLLGKGSNLLVSDQGIRGAVIKLEGEFSEVHLLEGNKIQCGAGATLAKLCTFALNNSLSGLEFAWGIPGSVGGAAFMNAGAYSGEMKDVLVCCEHITRDGISGAFKAEELELSYRRSIYSDCDYIITSIVVELKKEKEDLIRSRMDDFMGRRKSKQHLEYPSAGSVFKRPKGHFAGGLIEQYGLKGASVGGATVSKKHSGFIVNTGNATCKDVLSLIDRIKGRIREETGIEMECEVKIVGEF